MITWNENTVTSPKVRTMLRTFEGHYPIQEKTSGLALTVKLDGEGMALTLADGEATIRGGTPRDVARGIGTLLTNADAENGEWREAAKFKTIGVMLDCCRNAVMKIDYLKEWLRRIAIMGCDMMMLYTKDTYELPDEPYFGYLRGRYSAAELRELDDYAAKLGVEMIACVQALGHLEPVLRWPAYGQVKDTSSVLLTTEEKSYELIGKIIDFWSGAFKSRRMHLGMDETHDLGRGRYMDLNGYRRGFDIYNDHLRRVVDMCADRGIDPMIWSDMYFRMGSPNQDYYDENAVIPKDVIEKIPRDVQLVYWDYYHEKADFYGEWIRRHVDLGFKPFMASAVWTWPVLWCNHDKTVATTFPCVDACEKASVDEIVFTMWGDDGGYCDWSSAQAGLTHVLEKMHGGDMSLEGLERRFDSVCGGSFKAHLTASQTTDLSDSDDNVMAASLLWDDPLLKIYWKERAGKVDSYWEKQLKRYRRIASRLDGLKAGRAGDIKHARAIADLLALKIDLGLRLEKAYETRTQSELRDVRGRIPDMLAAVEQLASSFRRQWYERNKTFGFEVMQIRLAGQTARYEELAKRIDALLAGEVADIPELDEQADSQGVRCQYRDLATASVYL